MKTKIGPRYLENLRGHFRYFENGVPDLYSYGIFKDGITDEEVEDYLRIRANRVNVKDIKKKFNKAFGAQTARLVIVRGQEVILLYRYDVMRCADDVFAGKEHIPLD